MKSLFERYCDRVNKAALDTSQAWNQDLIAILCAEIEETIGVKPERASNTPQYAKKSDKDSVEGACVNGHIVSVIELPKYSAIRYAYVCTVCSTRLYASVGKLTVEMLTYLTRLNVCHGSKPQVEKEPTNQLETYAAYEVNGHIFKDSAPGIIRPRYRYVCRICGSDIITSYPLPQLPAVYGLSVITQCQGRAEEKKRSKREEYEARTHYHVDGLLNRLLSFELTKQQANILKGMIDQRTRLFLESDDVK